MHPIDIYSLHYRNTREKNRNDSGINIFVAYLYISGLGYKLLQQ